MSNCSLESMNMLQKITGHFSIMTVQNRVSWVLLLLEGTNTSFGFIFIFFFFFPSGYTIWYSVHFIILCGTLLKSNRFQNHKLHHFSYGYISENKLLKDLVFLFVLFFLKTLVSLATLQLALTFDNYKCFYNEVAYIRAFKRNHICSLPLPELSTDKAQACQFIAIGHDHIKNSILIK